MIVIAGLASSRRTGAKNTGPYHFVNGPFVYYDPGDEARVAAALARYEEERRAEDKGGGAAEVGARGAARHKAEAGEGDSERCLPVVPVYPGLRLAKPSVV